MKALFLSATMVLATLPALPATAADLAISMRVGQPGFYGSLDIGDYPPPRLAYAQPVIIQPVRAAVLPSPLYLRVPPGQIKQWARYCDQYSACGRPAYFVTDDWYQTSYAPLYRERHGREHKRHAGWQHGRHKGHDH